MITGRFESLALNQRGVTQAYLVVGHDGDLVPASEECSSDLLLRGYIVLPMLLLQSLQHICVPAETFFLFSRCQVLIVVLSQDTVLCGKLLELFWPRDLCFVVTGINWQYGKQCIKSVSVSRLHGLLKQHKQLSLAPGESRTYLSYLLIMSLRKNKM